MCTPWQQFWHCPHTGQKWSSENISRWHVGHFFHNCAALLRDNANKELFPEGQNMNFGFRDHFLFPLLVMVSISWSGTLRTVTWTGVRFASFHFVHAGK